MNCLQQQTNLLNQMYLIVKMIVKYTITLTLKIKPKTILQYRIQR